MNPGMAMIVGLLGITIVACADGQAAKKASPPPPHSPAALDMRGDCMTPPCGATAQPIRR